MEAVDRYLALFEELRRKKRWSTDTNVLRFAALALAANPTTDAAGRLEAAAEELRIRAGWFGKLNSPIRYVVAAMILRKELRPGAVYDAVVEVQKEFRARRYRRGGVSEVLAAVLLVLQSDGRPPKKAAVDRVGAILERWKRDHRFLTGPDDYPMAALHAWRDDEVESVAVRVERIYRALRAKKFSMGNALQLASHILALGTWNEDGAAARFDELQRAFKDRGDRIGTGLYDELALLALTAGAPVAIATRVLADVERLRSARPRPAASVAFSIAAGLALSREAERRAELASPADAAALAAVKALLDAQTAAMAAMAGAVVATAAASSASH
jgi:hypothetical protein